MDVANDSKMLCQVTTVYGTADFIARVGQALNIYSGIPPSIDCKFLSGLLQLSEALGRMSNPICSLNLIAHPEPVGISQLQSLSADHENSLTYIY